MTDIIAKTRRRIKVDLYAVYYTILFALFFPPTIFENISQSNATANSVLAVLQMLSCVLLIISTAAKRNMKLTAMEIALFLFVGWGLFLSLAFAPEYLYQYAVTVGFKVVTMVLFVKNIGKRHIGKIVRGIAIYFIILIWINAVLMCLFPEGVFQSNAGATVVRANWIFGSKNNVTKSIILAVTFLYLDDFKKKRVLNRVSIFLLALEAVCMGSYGVEIMGGSVTAMFVLIIFGIAAVFHDRPIFRKLYRSITPGSIALISIVLTVMIWYISLNEGGIINEMIARILEPFGRDLGFSGRDVVWGNMLLYIRRKLITGYSYVPFSFTASGRLTSTTYSFWGGIVLYYGVIGLVLMFGSFLLCERTSGKRSTSNNALSFVLKNSIFLLMVLGLSNRIDWQYVVLLLEWYSYSDRLLSLERLQGSYMEYEKDNP